MGLFLGLWCLPGVHLEPTSLLVHLLPTILNDGQHSCLPATRPSEGTRPFLLGLICSCLLCVTARLTYMGCANELSTVWSPAQGQHKGSKSRDANAGKGDAMWSYAEMKTTKDGELLREEESVTSRMNSYIDCPVPSGHL